MSFENIIKRKSKLLLPFSWLYQTGVIIHNKIYDWGWKKSEAFDLPVICVGNLSVGGTGKTPMVEYLLRLLSSQYKVATISRGYKRQSAGVLIANENTTAADIGDEPMQFHSKFPAVKVVVAEKRAEGIQEVVKQFPETGVIILDDAFQHRAVKAGLNILLTDYNNLFTQDYYLPAGQLRDLKCNYTKADIIIITKCPAELSVPRKYHVIKQIKPLLNQKIYFTTFNYSTPYNIFTRQTISLTEVKEAVLVTGIANPQPLTSYLKRHDIGLKVLSFPDHHKFSQSDIDGVKEAYQSIKQQNKIIITTEKDSMRLKEFVNSLQALPVYALPVQHHILFDEGDDFNNLIYRFIQNKK